MYSLLSQGLAGIQPVVDVPGIENVCTLFPIFLIKNCYSCSYFALFNTDDSSIGFAGWCNRNHRSPLFLSLGHKTHPRAAWTRLLLPLL